MKYIIQLDGQRVVVDLDGEGVHIAGQRIDAQLSDLEGSPVRLVRIGAEVHRVVARRGTARGEYAVWIDGYRLDVEALDERTRTIRDLSVANDSPVGPAPLIAPMPGLIVRVSVGVGDPVQAGQGLVVMEAMKMENELRAAAAGTVKAIHVTPGAAVEKGALLIELQ
jgi:biotin carboxyl carrier protein